MFKKKMSLFLIVVLLVGLLPTSLADAVSDWNNFVTLKNTASALLANTDQAETEELAMPGEYWANLASKESLTLALAMANGVADFGATSDDYNTLNTQVAIFSAARHWKPATSATLETAINDATNAKSAVKLSSDPTLTTDELYMAPAAENTLNGAISVAQGVIANLNIPGVVTQSVLNQATIDLNNAISTFDASLERKTVKKNLQDAINLAISHRDLVKLSTDVLSAGDLFVTPAQKTTLQNAIDTANTVYNNKKALQLDVNNASAVLGMADDTFAGLIKTASNKVALQAVKIDIDAQVARISTEALKVNVTDASYWAPAANRTNLIGWQTAVGNVLAQATASQSLVDETAEDATTFLFGFNSVVQDVRNLGDLNIAISDAETAIAGVVKSDTPADVITTKQCASPASYDALSNAIAAAKATQSDQTKLQLDIQAKLTALSTARGGFNPANGTLAIKDKASLTGYRASILTLINVAQISDLGNVRHDALIWKTPTVRTAFLDALAELDAAIAAPVYDEQIGSLAFKRLTVATASFNTDLVQHVVDNTAAAQTANNVLLAIQALEESTSSGADVRSNKRYAPDGEKAILSGRQQTLATAINSATRTQNLLQAWTDEITALSTYVSNLPYGHWELITQHQWDSIKSAANTNKIIPVLVDPADRLELFNGDKYTEVPHEFALIYNTLNAVTFDSNSWQHAEIFRDMALKESQSEALIKSHLHDYTALNIQKTRFTQFLNTGVTAANATTVPHGTAWFTPAERSQYVTTNNQATNYTLSPISYTQKQINTLATFMSDFTFKVANVDTVALNNAITESEALKAATFNSEDGADIEPTARCANSAGHTAFANAIAQAKTARDNANRTQTTIGNATVSLNQARFSFEGLTAYGTGPDRSGLELGLVTKFDLLNTELFGGNIFLSTNGQDILNSKAYITTVSLTSIEQDILELSAYVADRANISYKDLIYHNSSLELAIGTARDMVAHPNGQLASIDDTTPPTLINLNIQTLYPVGSKMITVAADVNETCAVTVALYPINAPVITDPTAAFNASGSAMYKKTLASPNHLISVAFENLPVNGAYRVYVMAKDQNGNITPLAPRASEKQNASAPVAPIGIRVLTLNGTGKIASTNNTMEYRALGSNDWIAVTGTEVEGLAPGNYEIRYKGTATHHPSTIKSVTITPYEAPPGPNPNPNPNPGPSPSGGNANRQESTKPTTPTQGLVENGKVVDVVAKGIIEAKTVPVAKLAPSQPTLEVSANIVDQLTKTKIPLVVEKENVSYTIPSTVLGSLPPQTTLIIKVTPVAQTPKQISDSNLKTLAPPVEFKMTTLDAAGKSRDFNAFNSYIERSVDLGNTAAQSGPINPVVLTENPDGTLRSVPTKLINNKVTFRSLTNSTYTVVDSTITVSSVKGTWAEKAVDNMASKFILEEVKNFEPSKKLTRGEFAEYIVKAMGLAPSSTMSSLKDVAKKTKQNSYIATAIKFGLAKGFADNTFQPNKEITRAEMAVMIANANKYVNFAASKKTLPKYKDLNDIPKWAGAMKTLAEYGIYSGYEDNTIRPNAVITHAEGLQVIDKALRVTGLIN